jgi:hypothetical protein
MRFLYSGLTLTLVTLTILSGQLFFREPRLEWAAYALLSFLGCGVVVPAAVRAWRGKPVDDRLIFIYGFTFQAFRAACFEGNGDDRRRSTYGLLIGFFTG